MAELNEVRSAPDADPKDRPGVPMEHAPSPAGAAWWREPERQHERPELTRRVQLGRLTPVFGSAQPPRGIAGSIRRAAYRIPEHKARHWMLLLLADRIETLSHRIKRTLPLALPLAAFWLIRREA